MKSPIEGATAKNIRKYESYKLAFEMIEDGIANKCPLQSIAVEESILTDRLSSTLNVGKTKGKPFESLGAALCGWHPKKGTPHPNAVLFDAEMEKLYPRIDLWRQERNALLHAIVKSAQGAKPETDAADFISRAMKAAEDGKLLARSVCNWSRKQIRKSSRTNIGK